MNLAVERQITVSGHRSFAVRRKSGIGVIKPKTANLPLRFYLRHCLPVTRDAEVNLYRLKNLANIWRGLRTLLLARFFGIPTLFGAVYATVRKADGRVFELGLVSLRVVTDTGVAYLVDSLQNLTEPENLKFHGFGTGTTAEAANQTSLVTELTTQYATDNTRPTGSLTEGASANIFRTVGTLSPDASVAITEHGVFSQAATGGGVMLDRSVFSGINLVSGDSLQITYDYTINSGN
jgi:hypothetical protein